MKKKLNYTAPETESTKVAVEISFLTGSTETMGVVTTEWDED